MVLRRFLKLLAACQLALCASAAFATWTGITLPAGVPAESVGQVTISLNGIPLEQTEVVDNQTCAGMATAEEPCSAIGVWQVRTEFAFNVGDIADIQYLDESGDLIAEGQVGVGSGGNFTNWLKIRYAPGFTGGTGVISDGFSLTEYYGTVENNWSTALDSGRAYISPRLSYQIDLSQSFASQDQWTDRAGQITGGYRDLYGSTAGYLQQPSALIGDVQHVVQLASPDHAWGLLGGGFYPQSSLAIPEGAGGGFLVSGAPEFEDFAFDNSWSVGVKYALNDNFALNASYSYVERLDCHSVQQGGGMGAKTQVRPPPPPAKEFVEGKNPPGWNPAVDGAKPPVAPAGSKEAGELIEAAAKNGGTIEVETADPNCRRTLTLVNLPPIAPTTTATLSGDIAPITGSTVTRPPVTLPPTTIPTTPISGTASIAPITGQTVPEPHCPHPTGKISAHMVDADVYTAILYPGSESYTSAADLLSKLQAKVAPHYDPTATCGRCIDELNIWGHGAPTGGYVTFGQSDGLVGRSGQGATPLSGATMQSLAGVGALMCVGGKVYINQCNAGKGGGGTSALQDLANVLGVPVSGPESEIKGCRIFGGALTSYKTQQPAATATTPAGRQARDVSAPGS